MKLGADLTDASVEKTLDVVSSVHIDFYRIIKGFFETVSILNKFIFIVETLCTENLIYQISNIIQLSKHYIFPWYHSLSLSFLISYGKRFIQFTCLTKVEFLICFDMECPV